MNRADIVKLKWFQSVVRSAYLKGQVDAYKNTLDGKLGEPGKEAEVYLAMVIARESEAEAEG